MTIRTQCVFNLFAVACFLYCSTGHTQEYPSKPVTLVVASSPGTPPDILARIMSAGMSRYMAQPVIVETKPGASTVIGYEYVARQAPADGYNIMVAAVEALAILPATVKELRFDPLKDLIPVIGLVEGRLVVGSSIQLPVKTFGELTAYAKANPGKLNYGANGSIVRLLTEVLVRGGGLNIVHVPYTAGGPYIQGLASGEVQVGMVAELQAATLGEKFRVLGVTGEQRAAAFPSVPTLTELGYPQIPGISYSLNVRSGTAASIAEKIHAAASQTLAQPESRSQFAKFQWSVTGDSPQVAARKLAEKGALFSDIAKQIGVRPE